MGKQSGNVTIFEISFGAIEAKSFTQLSMNISSYALSKEDCGANIAPYNRIPSALLLACWYELNWGTS